MHPNSTTRRNSRRNYTHKVSRALIIRNNKVLLAQRADNQPQPLAWELPGGGIERTETAEEAAIREVKEELGIDITITAEVGSHLYRVNPTFSVCTHLFLAHIRDDSPEFRFNDGEVAQAQWFDFDDLPADINPTTSQVILSAFGK